ncbi:MAG: hypothetical protein HY741_29785 [Chloroflexi bacterium]|nr:hypothetical protein [Chloroflexota bacterium]
MTKLLKQAIAEIEKLPEDAQDAIAAQMLAELEDELAWEARFDATTDEQWDRMVAMVRQEISDGNITPLDSIFPS